MAQLSGVMTVESKYRATLFDQDWRVGSGTLFYVHDDHKQTLYLT